MKIQLWALLEHVEIGLSGNQELICFPQIIERLFYFNYFDIMPGTFNVDFSYEPNRNPVVIL